MILFMNIVLPAHMYKCGISSNISLQIFPMEILGEIISKSILIDCIHLYMTCKDIHLKFSIQYGKYFDLIIYIMKKIPHIRHSKYILIMQIFDKPKKFIEKYKNNSKIQYKVNQLGYLDELINDGIYIPELYAGIIKREYLSPYPFKPKTVTKCWGTAGFGKMIHILLKHNDNDKAKMVLDRVIECLNYTSIQCALMILKKKHPEITLCQTFESYLRLHCVNMKLVSLSAQMGYNDILNNIMNKSMTVVILSAIRGNNMDLFKSLWSTEYLNMVKPKSGMYNIFIDVACMADCVEALDIILFNVDEKDSKHQNTFNCNILDDDFRSYIILSIRYGSINTLKYLLEIHPTTVSLQYCVPIRYISIYNTLVYAKKYISEYMPFTSLCHNRDIKSVNLLIQYNLESHVHLNDCMCGHKWKLY
jgi:hypothetical protein